MCTDSMHMCFSYIHLQKWKKNLWLSFFLIYNLTQIKISFFYWWNWKMGWHVSHEGTTKIRDQYDFRTSVFFISKSVQCSTVRKSFFFFFLLQVGILYSWLTWQFFPLLLLLSFVRWLEIKDFSFRRTQQVSKLIQNCSPHSQEGFYSVFCCIKHQKHKA